MGQMGNMPGGSTIALGIIVGLISTSVQSLGLTLQRKSHILEDEKPSTDARRPPHRRRRWQLGMGMFIISNLLGSTIQITTLPLPVLSTLQASGLVFNSICATLILGEPFTRWSLGGTLLVCSGAILIAIFGAIPEPAHNLDQLLALLGRRPFVIWMIGQAVLVVTIIFIAGCLARISHLAQNPRIRLLRGLAYGSISGILSAHSLLVAKSAVELLVRTIVDRKNQFDRWQSWCTLLSLVFLALTQLFYLHQGLKLVSTSVLYPLVFCIYNIIAILDGLIYFRQTSQLSALSACLIALGTAILLSGVLALSWRLSDEQTQPPPPQNSLVPGLGFVEDSDGHSSDSDTESSPLFKNINGDEESGMGGGVKGYGALADRALLANQPMTPTTKANAVLGANRHLRKSVRMNDEAVEIWGTLEDDRSSSPRTKRSVSSGHASTHKVSAASAGAGGDGAEENGGNGVGEHTALLRSTSERPRTRPRRKSTGFPGFTARRVSSHRRQESQDATGGFFKMSRWWKRGTGSRSGSRQASTASATADFAGAANSNVEVEQAVEEGRGRGNGSVGGA